MTVFGRKPGLDTPFKVGEKVQTTEPVAGLEEGTQGVVRVANGLGVWRRYWIRVDDEVVGQIDHDKLVRPKHLSAWLKRQEEAEQQALVSAQETVVEATESTGGSSNDLGIPEHLLERSKAAKQRLLG